MHEPSRLLVWTVVAANKGVGLGPRVSCDSHSGGTRREGAAAAASAGSVKAIMDMCVMMKCVICTAKTCEKCGSAGFTGTVQVRDYFLGISAEQQEGRDDCEPGTEEYTDRLAHEKSVGKDRYIERDDMHFAVCGRSACLRTFLSCLGKSYECSAFEVESGVYVDEALKSATIDVYPNGIRHLSNLYFVAKLRDDIQHSNRMGYAPDRLDHCKFLNSHTGCVCDCHY